MTKLYEDDYILTRFYKDGYYQLKWKHPKLFLGGVYLGVDPSCNKEAYEVPLLENVGLIRWNSETQDWQCGRVINNEAQWFSEQEPHDCFLG